MKIRLRAFLESDEGAGSTRSSLQTSVTASAPSTVTATADGSIPWGAVASLYSEADHGLVALDPSPTSHGVLPTSLLPGVSPITASTFQIVPAGPYGPPSSSVCYGDTFYLASGPGFGSGEVAAEDGETGEGGVEVFFLASQLKSATSVSYPSGKQEVYGIRQLLAPEGGSPSPPHACVWTLEHFDPQMRDASYGLPVASNGRVLLRHVATNACLASTGNPVPSSLGPGSEIAVHTFLNTHKAELPQNHFAIALATPDQLEEQ